MGTVNHDITSDEWTQVTESASGSLFVQRGSAVALTQAETLPTTVVDETPLLCILPLLEDKVYYGVATENAIYARALTGNAKLTNTPVAE